MIVNKNDSFKNFIAGVDEICDWIPLVSTITNIVGIALKCLMQLNLLSTNQESRYLNNLKEKEIKNCVLGLIPIIGNIALAYVYCIERFDNEKKMLALIETGRFKFRFASERLQNDDHFRYMALAKIPKDDISHIVSMASDSFKKDPQNGLAVAKYAPHSLFFMDESLCDNGSFMLDAVKEAIANSSAQNFSVKSFTDDPAFLVARTATIRLLSDSSFVLELVKLSGITIAATKFRNDPEIAFAAIRQNKEAIRFLDEEFRLKHRIEIEFILAEKEK